MLLAGTQYNPVLFGMKLELTISHEDTDDSTMFITRYMKDPIGAYHVADDDCTYPLRGVHTLEAFVTAKFESFVESITCDGSVIACIALHHGGCEVLHKSFTKKDIQQFVDECKGADWVERTARMLYRRCENMMYVFNYNCTTFGN